MAKTEETEAKSQNISISFKNIATIIGAVVTASTAGYAALKPEQEGTAKAAYKEISGQIKDLQAWAKASEQTAKSAEATCKAEVFSIRMYVTGYLIGLSRTEISMSKKETSQQNQQTQQSIKVLLESLTRQKLKASGSKSNSMYRPQLKPLPSIDTLQQQSQ